MQQYAVNLGSRFDRIQMNPKKSVTLSAAPGGMGVRTGLYCLKPEDSAVGYIVRKLTPIECERLQGLPDNYSNVEFKGKSASDSKRYKAIGNGMAHPCALFVLQQICKASELK